MCILATTFHLNLMGYPEMFYQDKWVLLLLKKIELKLKLILFYSSWDMKEKHNKDIKLNRLKHFAGIKKMCWSSFLFCDAYRNMTFKKSNWQQFKFYRKIPKPRMTVYPNLSQSWMYAVGFLNGLLELWRYDGTTF